MWMLPEKKHGNFFFRSDWIELFKPVQNLWIKLLNKMAYPLIKISSECWVYKPIIIFTFRSKIYWIKVSWPMNRWLNLLPIHKVIAWISITPHYQNYLCTQLCPNSSQMAIIGHLWQFRVRIQICFQRYAILERIFCVKFIQFDPNSKVFIGITRFLFNVIKLIDKNVR